MKYASFSETIVVDLSELFIKHHSFQVDKNLNKIYPYLTNQPKTAVIFDINKLNHWEKLTSLLLTSEIVQLHSHTLW